MSEMKFGITKDTRSAGVNLFPAPTKIEATKQFPNGYKFPVGRLVNVVSENEYDTKNGKQAVVEFVFSGAKSRVQTHTEWAVDPTDIKADKKLEGMQSRIKHILEQVGLGMPKDGIGAKAASYEEFFDAVAEEFNKHVILEDEKPVKKYYKKRVYLKLTYYKTNLNFPMFPNFIQLAEDDKGTILPCNLTINPTYDNIEPTKTEGESFSNVDGSGGGAAGDLSDLPDFD